MSYTDHALREFRAAGWLNDDGSYTDGMQAAICQHVLKLLEVFEDEGHSGSSVPYAVDLFSKVALFKPIMPLTGSDSEWNEIGAEDGQKLYQNNRCSHVFKLGDEAYDSQGIIFWEWFTDSEGNRHKSHFVNSESRTPVTFPYTPTKIYRERVTGEA